MTESSTAPTLARAVIAELLAAGVRDLVLSPGSRNAGLALAAAAADEYDKGRLTVRIDERDAGFTALGLALATDRPVAVITTSGTAAGNLLPAVMEASHSHVPIILVTADRPSSLLDTGSNQTTRQRGLYGQFVRADGALESGVATPASTHFQIGRLVAAARGDRTRNPGPVHLNVGLEPPLVNPGITRDLTIPAALTTARSRPGPAVELDEGPRTVVLAGHARPAVGRVARQLASSARVPLLAEPSSNARSHDAITCYRLLVGGPLGQQIERVIVYGHPTLSRPVSRLLARDDIELIVVSDTADWFDPGQRASRVVSGVSLPAGPRDWVDAWRAADRERLADFNDDTWCGRSIAGAVVASLAPQHNLVYGASQLLRDADLATVPGQDTTVWANRGLSGIDGTIATAMGIAIGRGPTVALVGDVTLIHDAGGLQVPRHEARPDLRVVVGNDDGGAIFSYLEQGAPAYQQHFERVFATPHGVDLAALAAAHGWDHQRCATMPELRAALAQEWSGLQLIEARLPR